jgi:transposase
MKLAPAARELGISGFVLKKWVQQYRAHGDQAFPGKGNLLPHEEELRRLQRENHRLKTEKEILKKAISFFAEYQK